MVRVHLANGGTNEYDANWHQVGPAGELTLSRVDMRQGLNAKTGRMETQVSNPQPVVVLAPGTWDRVDNLDLDRPGAELVAAEEAAC